MHRYGHKYEIVGQQWVKDDKKDAELDNLRVSWTNGMLNLHRHKSSSLKRAHWLDQASSSAYG